MSDLVECRLCGKGWRSLGHHLARTHDMTADEYRDRFGIRRGTPLTSAETRARMAEALKATIAAGKLDEHYAGNAARAGTAGLTGNAVKRAMLARGVDLPVGAPATPRHVIEAIVAQVEGGAKVASAVRRSPISYTGFHAGLARHTDLKARMVRVSPGYYRAAGEREGPETGRS